MSFIALIGAGQLGSRHLQALARLSGKHQIYVIDPQESSLNTSKDRFQEVCQEGYLGQVTYSGSFDILPGKIDIAIIATGSAERLEVLQKLLEKSQVQNVVLEKIVFNQLSQFAQAQTLFAQKGIKAYVNCPRRMWPSYQKLQELLKGCKILEFLVSCSAWDLGCNGIHFLDLFTFLSGQEILNISPAGLEPGYRQSRRTGYLEFDGIVAGTTREGAYVRLRSSDAALAEEMTIQILGDNAVVNINESKQTVKILRKQNNWKLEEFGLDIVYQSQLSNRFVEQLVTTGTCELTPFADSINNHRVLIEALATHMCYQDKTHCPIT